MPEMGKKPDAMVHIYLGRKTILWGLASVAACAVVYGVFSETLTMTAFYPSPFGAYAQILTTQSTFLATGPNASVGIGTRNPLAGSALDIEGANRPVILNSGNVGIGKTNPSSALDVQGAVNISGAVTTSGVTNANGGLILPKNAAPNGACSTSIGSDGSGNLYACVGGLWQASGGSGVSGLPKGMIFTLQGNNPTCPSGSSAVDTYWNAKTCTGTGALVPYCGSGARYPAPNQCDGSCTTPAGWQSAGGGAACRYNDGGVWNCFPIKGGGGWRISCSYSNCGPSSWTQVQCKVN